MGPRRSDPAAVPVQRQRARAGAGGRAGGQADRRRTRRPAAGPRHRQPPHCRQLPRVSRPGAGIGPARPYLDRIRSTKTRAGLAALFAAPGYPSPVAFSVEIDAENPGVNAVYTSVGGLGLPDRDYYLVDKPGYPEVREKYRAMLAFMLGKAGFADPAATAAKVYDFERKIAVLDWDRAVQRNPLLRLNRMTRGELLAMGGAFPLAPLLDGNGLGQVKSLIVAEVLPSAEKAAKLGIAQEDLAKLGGGFPALIRLLGEEDIGVLQAWCAAHFMIENAAVLPSDVDDARFAFFSKTLQGRERDRQRWQRALSAVQAQMGEAIGKVYVERHFPPSSKTAMITLVANLRAALAAKLAGLDWMSPPTRAAALAKLNALTAKIGLMRAWRSNRASHWPMRSRRTAGTGRTCWTSWPSPSTRPDGG
jgi:putative endopeptidase